MSSSDDIIRGYSPEVMKRLLGYIKPYKISAVFTLIALVLATTAELLMPIVMKRTLDDHLLRRENRLILETVESAASGNGPSELSKELASELLEKGVRIGDSLFVTPKDLSDLHSDERLEARAAGWLDSNNWYVVSNPDEMAMTVIDANSGYFKQDSTEGNYAILSSDRDSLTTQERRTIRSEDSSGLASRSVQYLILLVIVIICTILQVYNSSWVGQKIMAYIRQRLLGHIMRQSLRYLGKTPVGCLVSRTANAV